MSNNKPNIAQIRKYLNGELNARAMFELERDAQSDPFLWDVIKGMESSGAISEADLNAIDQLLRQRIEQDKKRVVPIWQSLSIAASLLIALGIGGWYLSSHHTVKPVVATTHQVEHPDKVIVKSADTAKPIINTNKAYQVAKLKQVTPANPSSPMPAVQAPAEQKGVSIKSDTVEYKASAYAVNKNASVNYLLKKLPGVDVDANGNVTAQGQQVTKVKINGKDFFGGDVHTAAKNLPADILSKVQVIDDYGDQANKTGIKSGEPAKVLNLAGNVQTADGLLSNKLKFDTSKLAELSIVAKKHNKQDTLSRTLTGRVAGVQVNDGYNNNAQNIRLRGSLSLGQDKQPLYVIDGIPNVNYKLGSISSSDIKNIQILKDSSVTAIYGSRAANGVVAITTKKGMDSGAAQAIDRDAGRDKKTGTNNGQLRIAGQVVDKNGHEPLPGVSISVDGSKTSTQTDMNGRFIITMPGAKDVLSITYIGYDRQQVKVKNRDSLTIALSASNQSLSEVVVTGYGTQKETLEPPEQAHPAIGWEAYSKYLRDNATMPNGATGNVKVSFMVDVKGAISNIRIVKGQSEDMNKKAIQLIRNGSAWVGEGDSKLQTITIKFHK